jgi:glycosyltransferase involved in cell wall biosynthesis
MLAQFYPPTIGGEERHVRNLAIALVQRGHSVAVATLQHGDTPTFELDEGVRVHRIRGSMQRLGMLFSYSDRQFAPPFADPELVLALQRVLQEEQPDILHAHNWIIHSTLPLKAWSRAKLVVTLHDYSLVCVQKRLTYHGEQCTGPAPLKCLECASEFYGAAKGIPTVLTNWTGSKLENALVDMFLPVSYSVARGTRLTHRRVPHRVIPNFVPDNISEQRNDGSPLLKQLPQGDFMLFVGDVKRDKGVDVLLQAYAAMKCSVPLAIIGRPCDELGVDIPENVLILPDWPHDAVMSAWRRCVFAVVPSIWRDPCPTVAMEAMAMGRPVIASHIGGLSDIIEDEVSGQLVPPGNVQALRQAMEDLLANPTRRTAMGRMALERVALFQARTVVPRIEQTYFDVLDVKRAVPMSAERVYQEVPLR